MILYTIDGKRIDIKEPIEPSKACEHITFDMPVNTEDCDNLRCSGCGGIFTKNQVRSIMSGDFMPC